jgi:hypothetical protein
MIVSKQLVDSAQRRLIEQAKGANIYVSEGGSGKRRWAQRALKGQAGIGGGKVSPMVDFWWRPQQAKGPMGRLLYVL